MPTKLDLKLARGFSGPMLKEAVATVQACYATPTEKNWSLAQGVIFVVPDDEVGSRLITLSQAVSVIDPWFVPASHQVPTSDQIAQAVAWVTH